MSGSMQGPGRRVAPQRAGGIVQMPNAAGDSTSIARAMMGLSQTLNGVSEDLQRKDERRSILQAENDARTMAIRGEDGGYVRLEGVDPATPAGRAMVLGVGMRVVNEVSINGDAYFRELRQGPLGQDRVAYGARVDQYVTEMASQVPEYARPEVEVSLRRRAEEYKGGVGDKAWETERGLQAATSGMQAQLLQDDVVRLAEVGITSGPQFDEAKGRLSAHYGDMVRTLQITPLGAQLQMGVIQDRAAGVSFGVEIGNIARTQGPQAARAAIAERLDSPEMAGLSTRAATMARAEGMQRIGVVEQAQSYRQGELRGRLTTVAASVRSGVTATANQLETYAQQADAAGMPAEAGRFRALGEVQGEIAITSRMPLPEIMAATLAAKGRDPEDPASAMRLSELQQLHTERVAALRGDPVGFARSQPLVQEAVRRVAAGTGTMQDVVAAQDAVLTANGVDPVGHRIVPQAEVAQLKDAIQNKPIVGDGTPENPGAAAILTGVFRRYGPENAHRVWNDLRGAGLPEELRPVALLLTSPNQQNALRTYMEATRVGADKLRDGLGTDTTRSVREAVVTAMQGLRDTDSGTGQDAQLMADAGSAAQTLALVYAGQGTAKEAAQRAVADVTAGLRIVDGSLGRFRVPRGVDYDQPAFLQAMGRMLGREAPVDGTASNRMGQRGTAGGFYDDAPAPATGGVRPDAQPSAMSQVRFRIPAGAISPGLTEDQQQDAFRRSLQTFGRFRTAPDGGGVWLQDDKGRPVFTEDGKPFGIRFGEERSPAGPAALQPTAPRGVRNNNPLNLEFRNQSGATMESHQSPRFARFGSMEDGVAAATQQLLRYGERGQDSVQTIISRWAPPSENDTAAYVAQVSRAVGVQPGQQLNLRDPAVMEKLVAAMAQKENGRPLDAEALRRGVARGLPS